MKSYFKLIVLTALIENYSLSSVMNNNNIIINENKFTFVYSHGFNSAGIKSKKYIRQEILPKNTLSFNYEDATRYLALTEGVGLAFGLHNSAIGQLNDVKKLAEQIDQINSDNIILFGESRGASTIINYLGSQIAKPSKIKAVILDSPFDELINVISFKLKNLHLSRFLKPKFVERCFSSISKNYTLEGLQPINTIKNVSKEIPVLFICSKEDSLIPWTSSLELYKCLIRSGHKRVHILTLAHGNHAFLTDGKCKKQYRNGVHAFFNKYSIPCHECYAVKGEKEILSSQPTIEQIDKFITNIS